MDHSHLVEFLGLGIEHRSDVDFSGHDGCYPARKDNVPSGDHMETYTSGGKGDDVVLTLKSIEYPRGSADRDQTKDSLSTEKFNLGPEHVGHSIERMMRLSDPIVPVIWSQRGRHLLVSSGLSGMAYVGRYLAILLSPSRLLSYNMRIDPSLAMSRKYPRDIDTSLISSSTCREMTSKR